MRKRIGQLECLVREGESQDKVVILLHGFGADASDLAPLADFLDPEGEWTFVFPEAPLEVPIGPMWTGRAWFPISQRDLEVGVDFTQIRPPGLDPSQKLVHELIFHLNPKTLVLGGFSQGAMVATDVAMHNSNDVHGLILYSGVLLDEGNWTTRAKELTGKPVLQSHGHQDTVLPFAAGQRLAELLKSAGAQSSFLAFGGAHEIPLPVLQKTKDFLKVF